MGERIIVNGHLFGASILYLQAGWKSRNRDDDPGAWYADVSPASPMIAVIPLNTDNLLSWAERWADYWFGLSDEEYAELTEDVA